MTDNADHPTITALKAGNQRFLHGDSIQCATSSLNKLRLLERTGQSPKAIILCCSDSRAPVEMLFDQDIGDLFVIRVAGNIIAPSLMGSIEFAALTFGTDLVVVMGHSRCGAVQAALADIHGMTKQHSHYIQDIISRIRPNIPALCEEDDENHEQRIQDAVIANTLASVLQIKQSSPLIQDLYQNNRIAIVGAFLDLSTGKIKFL